MKTNLRETAEEDAAARAADKVRDWVNRRLDEGALEIARLYRDNRDALVVKLRHIYENYLKDDLTIIKAKQIGATDAIARIVDTQVNGLAEELGAKSLDLMTEMTIAHPKIVNRWIAPLFSVEAPEILVPARTVLGELTTAVVGGGTYGDRLLNITQDTKDEIYGAVRSSLIAGSDFETLRGKIQDVFGVDTLPEPRSNAYGSVQIYRNEARRQWNGLMKDFADKPGQRGVWWAELDAATTPGCAARHGVPIDEIGDVPPRHTNCRCTVRVIAEDETTDDFQAEGADWLAANGYSQKSAYAKESLREGGPGSGPRLGQSHPHRGGDRFTSTTDPRVSQQARDWVENAGAFVNGIQDSLRQGDPGYLLFTDKKTGTTMMLSMNDLSKEKIEQKIKDKRQEFADAKKYESAVPNWGSTKLVKIIDVPDADPYDRSGLYCYMPLAFQAIPEWATRGGVSQWAANPRMAKKYADPASVLARASLRVVREKPFVSGKNVEILTDTGWTPIRGKGRWIEVRPGTWALDGPTQASWTTKVYRPSMVVLQKYPNLARLTARHQPGTVFHGALVALDVARYHALLAATKNDESAESINPLSHQHYPALLDQLLLKVERPGTHLVVWQVPEMSSPMSSNLQFVAELETGRTLYAKDHFPPGLEPVRTRFAVLCPQDGKVWAIKPTDRNTWYLPGGHRDPGETRGSAAVREMLEETGVRVTLEGLLGQIHTPWHTTVVFHGIYLGSGNPKTPDEIGEIGLIDPRDLDISEKAWVIANYPK